MNETTTAPATNTAAPVAQVSAGPALEAAAPVRHPPALATTPGPGLDVAGPPTVLPEAAPAPKRPADPRAPAALPGGVAPLWTVRDVARFLARSERFVWEALSADPAKPGSLPFIRIPGGRGCRGEGSPRFVAADIQFWVANGCPPAAVFRSWQEAEKKSKRKSA
jgi:hypothetical protein